MDKTMFDVTEASAEEGGAWRGTVAYEVLARLPRTIGLECRKGRR